MSIPREHRLRKHAEFELVYRCGQRHFSSILTAFYLLREAANVDPAAADEPRVGITVGRALGKAVARNRIKRRTRAAVVQNLGRIKGPIDVVINPKKVVFDVEFDQLCAEVARAFDLIGKKATPPVKRPQESATRPAARAAARKK
jgi:ribonuclease P protein component